MKKILSIISVIAAASLLSACAGGNGSSATESTETSQTEQTSQESSEASSETSSEETSDDASEESSVPADSEASEPSESESSGEFILYGPGGDVVKRSELTKITAADESSEITASNWLQASAVGFTYMAEPGGEYKRVKTGDEILGFTVGEAECTFSNYDTEKIGSESSFAGGYAELMGSVTLDGTIHFAMEDGSYYSAGDLLFVPDEDSRVLPVMNYSYSSDGGVYTKVDENGSPYSLFIVSVGEGMSSYLIPDDGSPVHVHMTFDNISMSSSVDVTSIIRADFTAFDIE